MFWDLKQTKKSNEAKVHVTHEIINIWKIYHYSFERGMGVVG